jgi:hypothetical protein
LDLKNELWLSKLFFLTLVWLKKIRFWCIHCEWAILKAALWKENRFLWIVFTSPLVGGLLLRNTSIHSLWVGYLW